MGLCMTPQNLPRKNPDFKGSLNLQLDFLQCTALLSLWVEQGWDCRMVGYRLAKEMNWETAQIESSLMSFNEKLCWFFRYVSSYVTHLYLNHDQLYKEGQRTWHWGEIFTMNKLVRIRHSAPHFLLCPIWMGQKESHFWSKRFGWMKLGMSWELGLETLFKKGMLEVPLVHWHWLSVFWVCPQLRALQTWSHLIFVRTQWVR